MNSFDVAQQYEAETLANNLPKENIINKKFVLNQIFLIITERDGLLFVKAIDSRNI